MSSLTIPPTPLIVLFAKAPLVNHVKTRMVPFLSPESAAELHRALVSDTLELLLRLHPPAAVELHTDLPTAEWPEFPVARRLQPEGDLGGKLRITLSRALAAGHAPVLILGSDSPGLPESHVRGLLELTADVKIGPAEDGGFYGIAARRACPEMFDGVRWSTPQTLADTRNALERAGLSVETGDAWFDIDKPADLLKAMAAPLLGKRTAEWLHRSGVALRLEGAAADARLLEVAAPVQPRDHGEDPRSGPHPAE